MSDYHKGMKKRKIREGQKQREGTIHKEKPSSRKSILHRVKDQYSPVQMVMKHKKTGVWVKSYKTIRQK